MYPRLLLVACICLGSGHGAAAQEAGKLPLQDAQFVAEIGASNHLDYADRLQMLSQRVAASACLVLQGVSAGASQDLLATDVAEFNSILDALEYGNDEIGIIGGEDSRSMIDELENLRDLWEGLVPSFLDLSDDDGSRAKLEKIADANLTILGSAKVLVSDIAAEYTNPTELLQADAITMEIAGRQRMLAQQISKDICFLSADLNAAEAAENLTASATTFELSLNALQHGMADAGVKAPPNSQIADGLLAVAADWGRMKPVIEAVLAGEGVGQDLLGEVFTSSNTITADMDRVVHLYSDASKLNL
jgi:hypothetical protein